MRGISAVRMACRTLASVLSPSRVIASFVNGR